MKPRQYQIDALNSIWNELQVDLNVLLEACCSAGKTFIFSKIVQRLIKTYPDFRVLILMDRDILVSQTVKKINIVAPELSELIGIACDSVCKKKDIEKQIVVASRQTLINLLDDFAPVKLIIIDECHLMRIPKENDSEEDNDQFGKIIKRLRQYNPQMRLFGVTATPYRTVDGYIYGDRNIKGCQPYFDKITYRITVDRLQKSGFLAPLKGLSIKKDDFETELASISLLGGDYQINQLSDMMCKPIHIQSCVNAYLEHAKKRKKILIFCVNIIHCEKVKDAFLDLKMDLFVGTIHSKNDKITNIKNMEMLKTKGGIFISVAKLTTGMDIIDIDCIIGARPTESPALYKQKLGRGQRYDPEKYPHKTDCLVIDLVGNGEKHGRDLDNLYIKYKKRLSKNGNPIFKDCPECKHECYNSLRSCPNCGYDFKILKYEPDMVELETVNYGKQPPVEMSVHNIYLDIWDSKSSVGKKLIRVRFELINPGNIKPVTAYMWMCLQDYYTDYAVEKGGEVWELLAGKNSIVPFSVDDAIERKNEISKPDTAIVDMNSQYPEILNLIYDDIPF